MLTDPFISTSNNTDKASRKNYEKLGHPYGPQMQTLFSELLNWLLHSRSATEVILLVLHLGIFFALVLWVLWYVRKMEVNTTKADMDTLVARADTLYIAYHLLPESTHMDILFLTYTNPENLEVYQFASEVTKILRRCNIEKYDTINNIEWQKGTFMEFKIGGYGNSGRGWAEDDKDYEGDEAAKRY